MTILGEATSVSRQDTKCIMGGSWEPLQNRSNAAGNSVATTRSSSPELLRSAYADREVAAPVAEVEGVAEVVTALRPGVGVVVALRLEVGVIVAIRLGVEEVIAIRLVVGVVFEDFVNVAAGVKNVAPGVAVCRLDVILPVGFAEVGDEVAECAATIWLHELVMDAIGPVVL